MCKQSPLYVATADDVVTLAAALDENCNKKKIGVNVDVLHKNDATTIVANILCSGYY
jgi:hypothetical protein